ncbi:MAG: hypothetical protein ACJ8AI_26845 [Rhodopila sp.]|jgi:hypothetical protein
MIRPITIATFLMACGSGLYLYQSKHEVQLLDRTIERTVHDTATLREQSKLLVAEWTMLNDPERLRQLSDTYLNLRSIAPTQFTSLTDLDSRLPAPRVEPPPSAPEPAKAPGVATTDPAGGTPAASDAANPVVADEQEEDLPVPPRLVPPHPASSAPVIAAGPPPVPKPPVPRPVVTEIPPQRPLTTAEVKPVEHHTLELPQRAVAIAKPAEHRVLELRPVRTADIRSPEPRPSELRPVEPRQSEPAHAWVSPQPKPLSVAAPAPRPAQFSPPPANLAAAAPYGGSLLGMARGSAPPAPRPMPVSTTQWSNTN